MKYTVLISLFLSFNILGMQQQGQKESEILSTLYQLLSAYTVARITPAENDQLLMPLISENLTISQLEKLKKLLNPKNPIIPHDAQNIIKQYILTGPVEAYFVQHFQKSRQFSSKAHGCASINTDGTRALTSSLASQGFATLWNITDLDNPQSNEIDLPKNQWIVHLVMSADGKRALASGAGDAIWMLTLDAPDNLGWVPIIEHKPAGEGIARLTISSDGKRALVGYFRGSLKLLQLDNPKTPIIYNFGMYGQHTFNVAFSLDGRKALTTSSDAGIFYWDLNTSDIASVMPIRLPSEVINDTTIALNGDGTRAFIAKKTDDELNLWLLNNPSKPQKNHLFKGRLNLESGALSADGMRGISSDIDVIKLWFLKEPNNPQSIELPSSGQATTYVTISANGNRAFAFGNNLTLFDFSAVDKLNLWEIILFALKRRFYNNLNKETKDYLDQQFKESVNLSKLATP